MSRQLVTHTDNRLMICRGEGKADVALQKSAPQQVLDTGTERQAAGIRRTSPHERMPCSYSSWPVPAPTPPCHRLYRYVHSHLEVGKVRAYGPWAPVSSFQARRDEKEKKSERRLCTHVGPPSDAPPTASFPLRYTGLGPPPPPLHLLSTPGETGLHTTDTCIVSCYPTYVLPYIQ